jgi:dolichyl-phosphate beta-glucosyltransferase
MQGGVVYNSRVKQIYLSVVIPCYDEMANLQKGVLNKVQHFLDRKQFEYEVIIADDGSKDGSVEFIEAFVKENPHFKLIKNPHYGKAGAVTTGMLESTGKYRLFTDMDQATPIEEIDKLLPFLESGDYDISIGSRGISRKGAPGIRLFISRSNIFLRQNLIGMRDIVDTQCGFKVFNEKSAEAIFSKFKKLKHGFEKVSGTAITSGLDVELLYLAKKNGFRIKEVPVNWLHVETRRVNPVRDSIQGVKDLLKIRKNVLMGKYNL